MLKPEHQIESSSPHSVLLAKGACFAALLFFAGHCVWVIAGPEHRLMDWLYDDGFYYLVVAAHFSRTHVSTFDGVTLTTGYHPLWMWICAGIFGLRDKLDLTYVRLCMALSAVITCSLFGFGALAAARARRADWLWALALAATSYSTLNNGCSLMEWPLVIACWAALHWLLTRVASERTKPIRWPLLLALGFVIGVVGSLSRTDFGLVPVAYVVAALMVRRVLPSLRLFAAGCAALAGSAVGVALTLVYNHAMTGEWIQRSAEVKRLLASVSSPFNPVPALWQFGRVLLYLPPLAVGFAGRMREGHLGAPLFVGLLAIVLAAVAALILMLRSSAKAERSLPDSEPTVQRFQLYAAAIGVAGYAIFYSFNSEATYGWYTATVTGFVLVLTARWFAGVSTARAAVVVITLTCCNLTAMVIGGPNARNQYDEVVFARQMRRDHAGAVMGGGDVGKPSFLNGGTLINTDGLMNNEVYPFLQSGMFPCYILARRIEYLSDVGSIPQLLTDGVRARKHLPPVPWATYFEAVPVQMPNGTWEAYEHTNFEAIQASGECGATPQIPAQHAVPVP